MKSRRHHMTRPFFPALLLVGVACAPDIPRPPPSERSTTPVTLPPSPALEARPYKKLRDDGSYTVEGALRDRDRIMGELVTVTGRVARLVKCAPVESAPAPAPSARGEGRGQTPPLPPTVPVTCNPPQHAVLVDPDAGPTPRWELVVYGTMRSALAGLSEGQEVSLSGDFAMTSKDGVFLRQGGMLLLPDDSAPLQPVTP